MARGVSAKEIGQRIREAREAQKMSGEVLGQKIGTDKGTVSRIERGEAGLSVERLQRIADALGVDPSSLLTPSKSKRGAPARTAARIVTGG
jgi:transcriptional regulator with XRE-family HTH domain